MTISKTKFKDCLLIEPSIFNDSRGTFFEAYKKNELESKLDFEVCIFNRIQRLKPNW